MITTVTITHVLCFPMIQVSPAYKRLGKNIHTPAKTQEFPGSPPKIAPKIVKIFWGGLRPPDPQFSPKIIKNFLRGFAPHPSEIVSEIVKE